MTDLTPQQKFLLDLQHIIGKHRNEASASEASAAQLRASANAHQAKAEVSTAEADRWQRLLDFAVLADHNAELAHAFANAVLDRGSVDPFANVTTYYAEWAQRAAHADDGSEPDDAYAEGERQAEDTRLAEENEAEWQAARAVEHVDYAEAEAVREIEREMAIEAGDDSEIDRQIAEDDARHERNAWLAARDAESGS